MSSSATTEPQADEDASRDGAPPRRLPILLMIGAILSILLIVAGVVALLTPSPKGTPANSLVGKKLPGAIVDDLSRVGGSGRLGVPWGHGHGAVLLFFADWCTVCHSEVPRLARELGRGDVGTVHVVGLDGDDAASVAAGFVKSNHVRFPVGYDKGLQVAAALVPGAFPAAVFIRSNGRIASIQYGVISNLQLSAGLSMIGHA
jgi:thiol-disulfide isomerase/thioredoxin